MDTETLPITGGRGYTYIDKETFTAAFEARAETLNLEPQDSVTLYRAARDKDTGEVVYLTLKILVLEVIPGAMLFTYILGDNYAFKTMQFAGYGENWSYIKEH